MDEILKQAAEAHAIITHPNHAFVTHRKYSREDFIAGAKWEASRHNSKCENLAQTLQAFRDAVTRECILSEPMNRIIALVDQCLLENKPNTIVP